MRVIQQLAHQGDPQRDHCITEQRGRGAAAESVPPFIQQGIYFLSFFFYQHSIPNPTTNCYVANSISLCCKEDNYCILY